MLNGVGTCPPPSAYITMKDFTISYTDPWPHGEYDVVFTDVNGKNSITPYHIDRIIKVEQPTCPISYNTDNKSDERILTMVISIENPEHHSGMLWIRYSLIDFKLILSTRSDRYIYHRAHWCVQINPKYKDEIEETAREAIEKFINKY